MNHIALPSLFKQLSLAVTCAVGALLAGCHDPEEFVLWAPDGQHALVRGAKEIALINPAGAIVAPDTGLDSSQPADVLAWMPDSRRVLAVRTVKARDWEEFATLLGAERATAVIRAADELLAVARRYQGAPGKFGEENPELDQWMKSHVELTANYSGGTSAGPGEGGLMAAYYLSQKKASDFATVLAQVQADLTVEEVTPSIRELIVRGVLPGEPPAEQLLLRSVDAITWVHAAPDGEAVAFVINEPIQPALYAIAVQPGREPVRVDEGTAQAAWAPDSKSLVYQKTTVPFAMVEEQAQLGTIARRPVRDAAGEFLAAPADPEDLAGILFSKDQNRIACLPDGRILFASLAMSLPAAATASPRDFALFALRDGATPAIERVVRAGNDQQALGRVDRFSVSPDGRHVAVPGGGGEVTLLSLETGEIVFIQEAPVANYSETDKYEYSGIREPAPTWRSATELCYIVPAGDQAGSPKRAEVVLRPLGAGPRAISRTWSDEMTQSFLPRPKP